MAGCFCGGGGARGTELAPAALSERGRQHMTTGSLPTLLDTARSRRLSAGGDPNAAARQARPTPPDGGDWLGEARRYLRSVRRHKWLVLSLTSFATAAGVELSMYALPDDAGAVLDRGAIGDSIGAPLGFAWVAPAGMLRPGDVVEFTVTTPAEAATRLRRELKVSSDADGNFLRLELAGPDAAAVTG